MSGKQQLGFALAAAIGGLMWGYVRHRGDRRVTAFALIQAAEWFVAYGGAAALLSAAHDALERSGRIEADDFEVERISRMRQVVSDRTGTEG
jgi:hypothetical protein